MNPYRRPHVGMLLYQDLTYDGRVQREAMSLVDAGYVVSVMCHAASDDVRGAMADMGVRVITRFPTHASVVPGTRSPFNLSDPGTRKQARGGRLGWAAGYWANIWGWGRWAVRAGNGATSWHVHDLTGLLAIAAGDPLFRKPVVYDSHELFLELGSALGLPRPARRTLYELEGRLARRCAGVITVNHGIAGELARRYGVSPVVVMNCPPQASGRPEGRLRTTLDIGDRPVVLYHGAVTAHRRGVEVLVRALEWLPEPTAVVILGNGSLVPWVREQQRRYANRLFWHPAVPLAELAAWVVDADLGVVLFAGEQLDFALASPNKIFECMSVGVPLLVSDLPVMKEIVVGSGAGEVCDPREPQLVAAKIEELLSSRERLAKMAEAAMDAARTRYNWATQARVLVELYSRTLPLSVPTAQSTVGVATRRGR